MQVFSDQKKRLGTLLGFRECSITTTLDSGDKELTFEYPADGKLVNRLKEECYIRTKNDEFVLKAVEKGEQFNKYTATLNVEELEGTSFAYGFESQEQTIKACLEFAFEGTGWTVGICTITKKRTINEDGNVTAWDILQKCLSTYRCECVIDSLNKVINIYEQIGSDKGCYFMEGLNLRKLSLKSDTYEFYSRIYPIGKDGITPESATGKSYIDNFQYSSKVKAFVWKDDRYTNITSLIEDATAKLEEVSRPYKAFMAEVADLARVSKKYRDILSYSIGDTVTLISKKKKIREKQRIVKITEYPETPEKNTVEISNARKTFAQIQQEETESVKDEVVTIAKNYTDEITARIEKTSEGIILEVSKKVGEDEIISKINQSPEEITIAASKINLNGAITANNNVTIGTDGKLTAVNAEVSGKVSASTMKAAKTYYITDVDFGDEVAVIQSIGDGTSDTEYQFGRLTINEYSKSANYISFKDESDDRQMHVYSGYADFHCPVFVESYIDIGTNSIRATDGEATIVDCSSAGGKFYYGASSSYADENALSALRGNTVRIYSHKSGAVYLGSSGSTAITSDETLKDLYEIDERYEKFFDELEPILYVYKKDGHRKHVGFGARAIENALSKAGLQTEDFAGILIDRDVTIGKDEMRTDEDVHFDELYSLRYEEFIALNTCMIKKIKKDLEELKKELKS